MGIADEQKLEEIDRKTDPSKWAPTDGPSWKKLIKRPNPVNGQTKLKEINRKTDPSNWVDKAGRN
ncbi:uncharacterized protein G2W53_032585 [Senna tora]|uniref:Uncharacterized protein n=1 Tax=Senna tora TaxID=362788 RepID=A0A834WBY6_9FABA|nr:uncharacterized protein G2W53_032585 [Senna tora]